MKETDRYRKAREYLEQVQKADNGVERLEMRMANLRALATDTANHMTGAVPGGKGDGDKIGRIMAEAADTEQQIAAAREDAERIRLEIRTTVSRIQDPVSQKTIMMRYLENRSLPETAKELGYCRAHTYRYQDMGYAEIEKILEDGTELS